MASLYSAYLELQAAEKALARSYASAYRLYAMGALRDDVRLHIHTQREQVYIAEGALYTFTREVMAGMTSEEVASRIPEPQRWHDLPRPQIMTGNVADPFALDKGIEPRAATDVERAAGAVTGIGVVIWAAVVIYIVAIVVAGVVAFMAVEAVAETVRRVINTRANTERYAEEVGAMEKRYIHCIEHGSTVEECAGLAPVPSPPKAPESERDPGGPNRWLVALAALGGVALLGAGVWGYGEIKGSGGGGSGDADKRRSVRRQRQYAYLEPDYVL